MAEGAPTVVSETVPQPLRYRGYWYDGWYDGAGDDQVGAYTSDDQKPLAWSWLGTRAYDPTLKRFVQPDPSARDGVRRFVGWDESPTQAHRRVGWSRSAATS